MFFCIINEKVLVLCEKWLSKFSSNLYVLRPLSQKNGFYGSICLCLSISKIHFLDKFYEIQKKSCDTKLFTTKRSTSLNRNIFFFRYIFFSSNWKNTIDNLKINLLNDNMWNTKKRKFAKLFVPIKYTKILSGIVSNKTYSFHFNFKKYD